MDGEDQVQDIDEQSWVLPQWVVGEDQADSSEVIFQFHDGDHVEGIFNELPNMLIIGGDPQDRRDLVHSMLDQLVNSYDNKELTLYIVGRSEHFRRYEGHSAVRAVVFSNQLDSNYMDGIVEIADEMFFEIKDRRDMKQHRRYPTIIIIVDEADQVLNPENLAFEDKKSQKEFLEVTGSLQFPRIKTRVHSVLTINEMSTNWEGHIAFNESMRVTVKRDASGRAVIDMIDHGDRSKRVIAVLPRGELMESRSGSGAVSS